MALLLIDLDNTLLDRASAFRAWAMEFARDQRAADSPEDVAWLIDADADGMVARDQLTERVRARFRLSESEFGVADLRRGLVDHLRLEPAVAESLRRAKGNGWTLIVVTNGSTAQQEAKLHRTGLATKVDGWVISETAGVRKPEPAIFLDAARVAGCNLDGAWMIGDSAVADIGGANQVGLRTAWIRRDREWTEISFEPTLITDSVAEALDMITAR